MPTISELLHKRFFTNATRYATGYQNAAGQSAYRSVDESISIHQVEQHLMGEVCLGAYTLQEDSSVNWIAFDVDATDPEVAKELTLKIHEILRGVPHVVEFSGKKGYHIILFLKRKVAATQAKNLADALRSVVGAKRSGDPHVEVFPKQSMLTPENPLGSLMKVPLGVHPVSGQRSYFLDPDGDWEKSVNPLQALQSQTTLEELGKALALHEQAMDAKDLKEELIELLVPHWVSGQRHDLSLALAGYLANCNWSEDETLDLVERIQQKGGGDLNNQLACVRDTYHKKEDGVKVNGLGALQDILDQDTIQQLVSLMTEYRGTPGIQVIDRVRMLKMPANQKVRMAADKILEFCQDNGSIIQDERNRELYWMSHIDRNLYNLRGDDWLSLLNNEFGINRSEAFSQQAITSIYDKAKLIAQPALTYNRAHWTGKELWLNLGTNTNYVLTGEGPNYNSNGNWGTRWGREVLNGEEGVIFRNTNQSALGLRLDLQEAWSRGIREVDPWEFLVNDLNFGVGSTGASPLQQRELLKAWFLATFFPEATLTRPLLTLVAPPGAGKTTAARRILKILEGEHSEVMGLVHDKPDSLRASIAAHKFIVLDNLEGRRYPWLADLLNRVSTGTAIELRELHTTNMTRTIIPDCTVIMTATSLPFSEESIFSRILPIELAQIQSYIPEYAMQQRLTENLESIWMGIFRVLDSVVRELNRVQTAPAPQESRLADFSVFCSRIEGINLENGAGLDGEALNVGLSHLVNRQQALLMESSPLIQVLDVWIRKDREQSGGLGRETATWRTARELHGILSDLATKNRLEWPWSTGQALSLHIKALEPHLVRAFGMRIRPGDGKHRPHQYRFEQVLLEFQNEVRETSQEISLQRSGYSVESEEEDGNPEED